MSATAQEVPKQEIHSKSVASLLGNSKSIREIRQLSQIQRPKTSAQKRAQSPAPSSEVVQVTGVTANPTDKGIEVILQTTLGQQLQITNRSADNNFIADIPNAQLRLPNGDAFTFRSQKPSQGITEITVTNLDANTIRVTVIGETGLPTVELFDSDEGLVFGLIPAATAMQPPQQQPQTPQTPEQEQSTSETQPEQEASAEDDEPIELVVTGEQDGYRVPNASTATKTDTPLRDIPQSIQIVPQEVLRDQNVPNLQEALRNVSGVAQSDSSANTTSDFIIRGFSTTSFDGNSFLRNGLRDTALVFTDIAPNIERIEVLKGPASVLYGGAAPGGTINIVTKQPLRDPFYAIDATIGSYDFYRGAIDLSGPLNDSRTVLYRLNVGYLDRGSFVDFSEKRQFSITPVISLAIGERTRLTLEGEYTDLSNVFVTGLPAVGTVLPNPNGRIPRNRLVGEPGNNQDNTIGRVGYRLEHQFSENWSLQNSFQAKLFRAKTTDRFVFSSSLSPDNRTLNRRLNVIENITDVYDLTINLTGKFSTGSINHQLVFGVDLGRYDYSFEAFRGPAASLDLFNPVYGRLGGPLTLGTDQNTLRDTLGIYVQDQVTLAENLKLLLGGRFDTFEQTNQNFLTDTRTNQSGDAFSPRVGIVYQPIEPISLYASYSRSFNPAIGTVFGSNSQFQPERGTQYEVGVKADLNDRLSATLALYDLTRSNVLTTDNRPGVPPGFSIQTGEQRSRGIELNIAGEILPGWNIIAGYAYTDAKITQDNTFPVGNRFNNVPENSFNLWTSYEIQQGTLQGLGFGAGLFYVGERQGDLGNTFQLPSYLRTDAAIFYKRDSFRTALNFRNLFNINYFETSFSRLNVSPGAPFTVQGTISWEF
ncbi:MAG: TonB-dependent siderophore receptor [Desmonostoc geniculatum HA4340-LM1]|jgi:iron complex outermembrane receptor protein|nr:TonB-dependent siderophore receptor [Desmonostoc geniculatum HA4340-LM1]